MADSTIANGQAKLHTREKRYDLLERAMTLITATAAIAIDKPPKRLLHVKVSGGSNSKKCPTTDHSG